MSDSSRVQLYSLEESILGTTPASPLNELRFTGESLSENISNEESAEIRSDRQLTDLIQVSKDAGGGFDFELSYGSYDDLLEGTLFSGDWPVESSTTGITISSASADNSFNDSGAGFFSAQAGDWIVVSGLAGNSGYFLVVGTPTASKIVVAQTLTDQAAGASVTVRSTVIKNGVTRKSYSLEKKFSDITQFLWVKGAVVSDFALSLKSNSIVSGSFSFNALDAGLDQSTIGTGAPVAAGTNPVLNASTNVGNIIENDAIVSGIFFESLDFTLNNSLRAIPAVGVMGNVDIGVGSLKLTGKVKAYFANNALYDKFSGGIATSLAFTLSDGNNAYGLTFPRIKFSNGQVIAGSKDQDVLVELDWTALRSPSQNCMVKLTRMPTA